eukprot:1145786-Pelagomonas_calceolata.AAC.1
MFTAQRFSRFHGPFFSLCSNVHCAAIFTFPRSILLTVQHPSAILLNDCSLYAQKRKCRPVSHDHLYSIPNCLRTAYFAAQYYQVPRLWLVGFDESRQPLHPNKVSNSINGQLFIKTAFTAEIK